MKKKKKINIEQTIWNFVDKHHVLIYFIIITAFSLIARYLLIKYESGDYEMFLEPWFNELKKHGGIMALGRNIGNYTPIYMTILSLLTYLPIKSLISIKLVSIIFEYIGGYYIYKIVKDLFAKKNYNKKIALLAYSIYIFLPTIILNSAYWAQSDAIYTTFVLISIYYLMKKNFKKGIFFWSVALAFKFQAIFILPLYIFLYISDRKIKIKYFLIVPITIFILSIAKVFFSHNILDGFNIYFNQSNTYSNYLTLNFPNVYSIFFNSYDESNLIQTPLKEIGTIGMIITLMIFLVIAFLVYSKKIKFDKKAIIDFGLWSVLICTFFLPQMHERYLFMGDVLCIIYFIMNKRKYYIPIIIELISLNGYMYLLFSGFALNITLLSILNLVLIVLYTKDMYNKYFSKTCDNTKYDIMKLR